MALLVFPVGGVGSLASQLGAFCCGVHLKMHSLASGQTCSGTMQVRGSRSFANR